MPEAITLLFGALFVSVFVWFFLVSRLFNLLKANHPDKYREMGEPTLIRNNAPKHSILLLKFLLTREYAQISDSQLTRLGNLMLVFFVLYALAFLVLFLGVALGYADGRASI